MSKKRIITIALCVAVLAYLAFANVIAAAFVPEQSKVKPYKKDIAAASTNADIYYAITDSQYCGDDAETMMICGWVYGKKDGENEELAVNIIFDGQKSSYAYNNISLSQKSSVNAAFNTKQDSGFTAYISTLNMKNDTYDIYIEAINKKGEASLGFTGRTFRKTGTAMQNAASVVAVEDLNAQYDESIDGAILPMTMQQNGLSLVGYCIKPNTDSLKTQLFACAKFADGSTKYYKLTEEYSADTAKTHGESAVRSNFNTAIPKSELKKGVMQVSLVAMVDDKAYSTKVVGGYDVQ